MKRNGTHALLTPALLLALGAAAVSGLPTAKAAPANNPPTANITKQSGSAVVTSDGFEDRIAASTLYMEVPIEGVIGENLTPDSVHAVMEAAANDPNIKHAVFMVDVDPEPRRAGFLDKDVIGSYGGKLTVHSVVRTGMNFGVFPIFFSDNIFVTEDAVIGNMPIHRLVPPGDDQVMAKMVGIFTNQLAAAAETHGHNPDIVRAMIDENRDLYYWRENGEVVVSGDRPANPDAVESFEQVQSLTYGGNLTIDQEAAIRIQLAEPISDYDAYALGELLEIEQWLPANRYGMVANEIGLVLAQIAPITERVDEIDKQVPDVQLNRDNRNDPEVRELIDFKRALDQAAAGLESITAGLEELMEIHPERHAYFLADNGQTILADPAQWQEDLDTAMRNLSGVRSGLTQLRASLIKFYQDPDWVDPISDEIEKIQRHLEGIQKHGNAAYWEEHYVPDLPPDIYG